jgi:hypothetical protein
LFSVPNIRPKLCEDLKIGKNFGAKMVIA